MSKNVIMCAAALLSSVVCAATNTVTDVTAATMLKYVPATTVLSNLVNAGAGSPTNRLLWESVTNLVSAQRAVDDLRVYRREKDCWVWSNWTNPMEPDAKPAPADFLAFANSPGSKPIYFGNDGWFGGTQFWPNGKRKYMKDPGPGGLGLETDLNFAFTAYDETGTNELFRFGAHAHRDNPTNETFVSWSDKPVNEFVRVATTDMVGWQLDGRTGTNDFVVATNDLWHAKVGTNDFVVATNDLWHAKVGTNDFVVATNELWHAKVGTNDFVVATNDLWHAVGGGEGRARTLPKYLHELSFDSTYPDDAAWYYEQAARAYHGACSVRRVGDIVERNYDWNFDDSAVFVVRMSAAPGRFASIGMAGVGTNLTEEIVTSGKWSRYYKCLPGHMLDGINERGVFAEINVVNGEPLAPGKWPVHPDPADGIHPLAVIRWVLDNASSAEEAANYLRGAIAFPEGWTQNFHYFVADASGTWLVEDGRVKRLYPGQDVVTNFKLDPWVDGPGIERYNVLMDGQSITNAWYTRTYAADTNWRSEFDFNDAALAAAKALWAAGDRESHRGQTDGTNGWWQTVHTAVYDIPALSMKVAVQETDDWYEFRCVTAGTGDITRPEFVAATNAIWEAKRDKEDMNVYSNVVGYVVNPTPEVLSCTGADTPEAVEAVVAAIVASGFCPRDVTYNPATGSGECVLDGSFTYGGMTFSCPTGANVSGEDDGSVTVFALCSTDDWSGMANVVWKATLQSSRVVVDRLATTNEVARKRDVDDLNVYGPGWTNDPVVVWNWEETSFPMTDLADAIIAAGIRPVNVRESETIPGNLVCDFPQAVFVCHGREYRMDDGADCIPNSEGTYDVQSATCETVSGTPVVHALCKWTRIRPAVVPVDRLAMISEISGTAGVTRTEFDAATNGLWTAKRDITDLDVYGDVWTMNSPTFDYCPGNPWAYAAEMDAQGFRPYNLRLDEGTGALLYDLPSTFVCDGRTYDVGSEHPDPVLQDDGTYVIGSFNPQSTSHSGYEALFKWTGVRTVTGVVDRIAKVSELPGPVDITNVVKDVIPKFSFCEGKTYERSSDVDVATFTVDCMLYGGSPKVLERVGDSEWLYEKHRGSEDTLYRVTATDSADGAVFHLDATLTMAGVDISIDIGGGDWPLTPEHVFTNAMVISFEGVTVTSDVTVAAQNMIVSERKLSDALRSLSPSASGDLITDGTNTIKCDRDFTVNTGTSPGYSLDFTASTPPPSPMPRFVFTSDGDRSWTVGVVGQTGVTGYLRYNDATSSWTMHAESGGAPLYDMSSPGRKDDLYVAFSDGSGSSARIPLPSGDPGMATRCGRVVDASGATVCSVFQRSGHVWEMASCGTAARPARIFLRYGDDGHWWYDGTVDCGPGALSDLSVPVPGTDLVVMLDPCGEVRTYLTTPYDVDGIVRDGIRSVGRLGYADGAGWTSSAEAAAAIPVFRARVDSISAAMSLDRVGDTPEWSNTVNGVTYRVVCLDNGGGPLEYRLYVSSANPNVTVLPGAQFTWFGGLSAYAPAAVLTRTAAVDYINGIQVDAYDGVAFRSYVDAAVKGAGGGSGDLITDGTNTLHSDRSVVIKGDGSSSYSLDFPVAGAGLSYRMLDMKSDGANRWNIKFPGTDTDVGYLRYDAGASLWRFHMDDGSGYVMDVTGEGTADDLYVRVGSGYEYLGFALPERTARAGARYGEVVNGSGETIGAVFQRSENVWEMSMCSDYSYKARMFLTYGSDGHWWCGAQEDCGVGSLYDSRIEIPAANCAVVLDSVDVTTFVTTPSDITGLVRDSVREFTFTDASWSTWTTKEDAAKSIAQFVLRLNTIEHPIYLNRIGDTAVWSNRETRVSYIIRCVDTDSSFKYQFEILSDFENLVVPTGFQFSWSGRPSAYAPACLIREPYHTIMGAQIDAVDPIVSKSYVDEAMKGAGGGTDGTVVTNIVRGIVETYEKNAVDFGKPPYYGITRWYLETSLQPGDPMYIDWTPNPDGYGGHWEGDERLGPNQINVTITAENDGGTVMFTPCVTVGGSMRFNLTEFSGTTNSYDLTAMGFGKVDLWVASPTSPLATESYVDTEISTKAATASSLAALNESVKKSISMKRNVDDVECYVSVPAKDNWTWIGVGSGVPAEWIDEANLARSPIPTYNAGTQSYSCGPILGFQTVSNAVPEAKEYAFEVDFAFTNVQNGVSFVARATRTGYDDETPSPRRTGDTLVTSETVPYAFETLASTTGGISVDTRKLSVVRPFGQGTASFAIRLPRVSSDRVSDAVVRFDNTGNTLSVTVSLLTNSGYPAQYVDKFAADALVIPPGKTVYMTITGFRDSDGHDRFLVTSNKIVE